MFAVAVAETNIGRTMAELKNFIILLQFLLFNFSFLT